MRPVSISQGAHGTAGASVPPPGQKMVEARREDRAAPPHMAPVNGNLRPLKSSDAPRQNPRAGQRRPEPSRQVVCADCGETMPAYMVGSTGTCLDCHFIREIDRVCGLGRYQVRERYDSGSYNETDGSIMPGNATRKPKVDPGAVTPHWLDTTPVRLSEMDLPKGLAPPRPRIWLPFATQG